METITFKTILASGRPFREMETDDYLKFLESERNGLYRGETGVYLSREIKLNGQKLYFPFIDVDGQKNLHSDEKIESAILNASLTLKILKELGVSDYFKIIATGNTGFRMISNILLNSETYQAFVDLVKGEMPHINDIEPTRDIGMPHQLFVYKGHSYQNKKQLVDGHSVIVPVDVFENEIMDAGYYRSLTAGKLDPDKVIDCMRWFFNFVPITDLKALGAFGEKLGQYRQLSKEICVNPFQYIQIKKNIKPIALDVMQKMLARKGIQSKVEKRPKNLAISFSDLPCPLCKKPSSNARAYPPDYTLKCFNVNCAANSGIPLINWAGIKNKGAVKTKNSKNVFDLQPPTEFQDIKSARDIIADELETADDTLDILTPGVGKTEQALNHLANYPEDKLVIYSAYNKDLQKEAYDKVLTLSDEHSKFHLILPRDEICIKKDELKQITSRGYSPAQILCPKCECRLDCDYYRQRENMETGVFFVTHHMLQYLESRVPKPDLIILDENLKGGFLLEDTSTELQMRTLATVLSGVDYLLVNELIILGQQIGNQILKTKSFPEIINGRKLTAADINEDTIIGLLAKRKGNTEIKIIEEIKRIINVIGQLSPGGLYHKGVNLKAVEWLKGLISLNRFSYMLVTANGAFYFNTKYITTLGYPGTPIKILDATGDARSARALVNRKLKVVKADVEWMSDKLHIQANTSRGVLKYATNENIEKLLIEMLNHTTAKKVMVVTYKFIKERVLRICNAIDPSRQYLDYHFIGPRGINAFKVCDAVIVIGLPYPNLNSCAQDACILFPYDKDIQTSDLRSVSYQKWGKPNFQIPEFEEINKCSYFDYQRSKIYLRTNKKIKKAIIRKTKYIKRVNKIDKILNSLPIKCLNCSQDKFYRLNNTKKLVINIKFMKNGIKKWNVQLPASAFQCSTCGDEFSINKYGRNLMIWSMNQYITFLTSMPKIRNMVKEYFNISVAEYAFYKFKSDLAKEYQSTYEEIRQLLINGSLIHADETKTAVKGNQGSYVWVFTSMDTVYYLYRPNREAEFLKDMLKEFKGVLVSDFFPGYYSLKCAQQKCLIHLIRDLNGDLLNNQINTEYRSIVIRFGKLLREIVRTIDMYGLRKRYLNKHKKEVEKYYHQILYEEYETELAISWQKRFKRNKGKLFTFLNYDDIPWNNNNSENAIKPFAKYRSRAKGLLRKQGVQDFLVLLSINQTCKYRGINFLDFLKSGEKSIEEYSRRR